MKTQNERRFHRGFKDFIDFLEKEIYSSTCSSRNSRKIPMQSQILLVFPKNIMVISSFTLWARYPSPKISWTGVLMGIEHWRMCISASGLCCCWFFDSKTQKGIILKYSKKALARANVSISVQLPIGYHCYIVYWILLCWISLIPSSIPGLLLDVDKRLMLIKYLKSREMTRYRISKTVIFSFTT